MGFFDWFKSKKEKPAQAPVRKTPAPKAVPSQTIKPKASGARYAGPRNYVSSNYTHRNASMDFATWYLLFGSHSLSEDANRERYEGYVDQQRDYGNSLPESKDSGSGETGTDSSWSYDSGSSSDSSTSSYDSGSSSSSYDSGSSYSSYDSGSSGGSYDSGSY